METWGGLAGGRIPADLSTWILPDLEPIGDEAAGTAGAFAFVTSMESAYCGRFDCAAVGVEASYGDVQGTWILTLIVSGEFPVQIGRESWGEVKKTGPGAWTATRIASWP